MNKRKIDIKFFIVITIAVAVFLYSGTKLGIIFWEYYKGQQEYSQLEKIGQQMEKQKEESVEGEEKGDEEGFTIDFKALKEINPDLVGWIRLKDLNISYPIVQGEDNEYYLNHSFRKEEIISGSIFMEIQNQPDFSDDNTFIYGHNMKDKSMFAKLNEFKDAEVCKENPKFFIYLEDVTYKYQIFSCYVADVSWSSFQYQFENEEKYGEWQKITKERSIYDTGFQPETNQKTVTLVTCTPAGDEARFVVHGALTEVIENK